MKVVFLNKILPKTGVSTHQLSLIENLIDEGAEVKVISGKVSPQIEPLFTKLNIEIIKVPFPSGSGLNDSKIIQFLQYIISLPICLYYLFRIKPDIIHVHWPITSFIASMYRKITGTPFVMTFHISGISRSILNRKANVAIAISNALENELITKFDYKESDVALIHNGINLNKFIDHEKLIDTKKFTISYIGTINYRKGIDTLIEAFAQANIPNKKLLIQGEGDLDFLNHLLKMHEVDKAEIELIGFGDPVDSFSRADCFVLASRKEGFPLVTLEAMASRVPVIRSRCEGTAEQIIDNETGLSFDIGDSLELKRLMELLAGDCELRNTLVNNAYNLVCKRFSSQVMADKMYSLYSKVITS